MIKWWRHGLIGILGFGWASLLGQVYAQAVVRERETSVTGPRGRTIDRRVAVGSAPGMIEREVQIRRPAGTFQRDVRIERAPSPMPYRAGGYGPRPNLIVQREIVVAPRPAPFWSFGLMAAPMFSIPFWPPPPPPVVVAPPVVVQRPGTIIVPATNQPSPLDPVALAAQRLQSHHGGSRREGAETLGRLRDPRAVPALTHALKYDSSKDVKIAAATALGKIGGQEAETVLERCIIYEKKQDVRDAAATALQGLRERKAERPESVVSAAPARPRERAPVVPPRSGSHGPFRPTPRRELQEPPLDGPASEVGASDGEGARIPPPPPTPVNPS